MTSPSQFSEQPPDEITINLLDPPSRTYAYFPTLHAFQNKIFHPSNRFSLVVWGICYSSLIVLLCFLFDENHQCFSQPYYAFSNLSPFMSIILSTTLFVTVPRDLYHLLRLPTNHTLTLSLLTQQMTLKRIACIEPSITIPLKQLIKFTATKACGEDDAHQSFSQDHIVAHTTGHPIKIALSQQSYQNAVSNFELGRFLKHHRSKEDTPTPYTPLPTNTETFRAQKVEHSRAQLPALSRLLFRSLPNNDFKCLKPNLLPEEWILSWVKMFLLMFLTPVLSCAVKDYEMERQAAFLATIFTGGLAISIVICYDRLTPKQCIFSNRSTKHSLIRRFLYSLVRVQHIPVAMYEHVEITPYRGLDDVSAKRWSPYRIFARGLLYKITFVSSDGSNQILSGFSQGETVCIIDRLQNRFPHLFDHRVEGEGDGDDPHQSENIPSQYGAT